MAKDNRSNKFTEKRDFAAENRERIEKMLEKAPQDTKAVIANTIETRRIAARLGQLDIIYNRTREKMGFGISFDASKRIFEAYSKIEEAMDEVFKIAEEEEIFVQNNKSSDLNKYKDTIIKLTINGKSVDEIAIAIRVPKDKVAGWIGTLKAEIEAATPKSVTTVPSGETTKEEKETTAKTKTVAA